MADLSKKGGLSVAHLLGLVQLHAQCGLIAQHLEMTATKDHRYQANQSDHDEGDHNRSRLIPHQPFGVFPFFSYRLLDEFLYFSDA